MSGGEATSLAVDASGNVVVTGYANAGVSGAYHTDYYTAKYAAADGSLLWQNGYDGPAHYLDYAYSVAVDGFGNVVVTGVSYHTYQGSGSDDYFTVKYAAADGSLLWAKRYDGPVGYSDVAVAVAVDGSGNVVVTGNSDDSGVIPNYYTAKYAAADGNLLWEKRYNPPNNYGSLPKAVAVDSSGNVVVTGFSGANYNDYYTAKYAAADGSLLWEKSYNGPGYQSNDMAFAVKMDGAGNAVVTGTSVGSGSGNDYYTAKYAATDGSLLWEKRYNGPANKFDAANAVVVDGFGNVVVTGASYIGSSGPSDYATVKYILDGPTVTTLAATGLTQTTATLNGTASPYSSAVTAHFEYGTTTSYGTNTANQSLGSSTGTLAVNAALTGLAAATLYHCRLVATNASGTTNGSDATFTTSLGPIQQWKLTHLGNANAPDLGDPDGDGLFTLAEYALNLSPETPNAPLAATRFTYAEGERLRIFVPRDPTHNDVTVEVQVTDSISGPWTSIATSTFGTPFVGPGYVSGDSAAPGLKTVEVRDTLNVNDAPARFLRVRVTR